MAQTKTTHKSISVELKDPNIDDEKARQLATLFQLVEMAYDEQTLEHRATKDSVSITMHFPNKVTFKRKDAFALAASVKV
jgi:hypothetical protein